MANPQAENGHIDIANEIAEALMRTNLNSYQWRILWAIWRKTYGWHKKEDWVSNSQFVEMTGMKKSHVSRTLKELRERKIVTSSGNKVAFNKDYTQWRELPRQVTPENVTSLGNGVTSSGQKLPCEGNTKETIQKKLLQKKGGDKVPQCPHQKIMSLYHDLLPEMPRVKKWTKERQKALRVRWQEDKNRQRLGWWEGFFKHIRESKFLMGENDRKWQPNLEWLIQESNLVNVIEGKYHN